MVLRDWRFQRESEHKMSAWRRAAIKRIPTQRALVERSESVGMLWVDLWLCFVDAHREPVDEKTIRGVYDFAKWTCEEARNDEMATSTCCHFYEHLPTEPLVRAQLRKFMTRGEVSELSAIFKYHLSEEEYLRFMGEVGAANKCKPRI